MFFSEHSVIFPIWHSPIKSFAFGALICLQRFDTVCWALGRASSL